MLMDRLAQESGHREVAVAPLLLWGHSRSGHFAATFAVLHSRRTVAIVGYHTGAAGLTGHDKAVLSNIPALILMAKADIEANVQPLRMAFTTRRDVMEKWPLNWGAMDVWH